MDVDCLILGAGAAGMMCAAQLGARALVVDHAKAPGEKIRISGGGRCNFTNLGVVPERFLSGNPHFAKSALARYTQWDFIDMVSRHGIAWHEKTLGQLFCDGKSIQIVEMMRAEMGAAGLWLETSVVEVAARETGFAVTLEREGVRRVVGCAQLVVATGGKSIPKMGATGLAYDLARQFGLALTETRPALVPLTFPEGRFAAISGVAAQVRARAGDGAFEEAMLFTHRGLSGPAMLQVSSYWREGEAVEVDLSGGTNLGDHLRHARRSQGKKQVATVLGEVLPARLVEHLAQDMPLAGRAGDLSDKRIDEIAGGLSEWRVTPGGTEGYRTAEVTLGGIETGALSSRSLEARDVPGLFFIGEAVDVTGWLGGYNFQWAWSSGWAAGQEIATRP
ncbi:MAG: NAD(P)/FAD-dependent oxidoreductase [Pseudomonadota bacterium]